jgi:hypothetical protein
VNAAAINLSDVRTGDLVEVRSREEILATLAADGTLERMPFMPEMLKYCGRQFRVGAVAHKTCDPAHKTGGRRLENSVHLEDLRCDGSAHGGCQAACLLFWKTAWLKRPGSESAVPGESKNGLSHEKFTATVHAPASTSRRVLYSCQATRLYEATTKLRWWDPRQYARDVYFKNVTPGRMAKLIFLSWFRALSRVGIAFRAVRAAYGRFHQLLLGRPAPEMDSGVIPTGAPTPARALGLQPGQRVTVKSYDEIRQTLNRDNKNRGMWFDVEATVFCGSEFEVERRVERIINEVTGEMMEMKTPCITLKGVYCRSMYSRDRLFCPRAITPYWREIWLRPVDDKPGSHS